MHTLVADRAVVVGTGNPFFLVVGFGISSDGLSGCLSICVAYVLACNGIRSQWSFGKNSREFTGEEGSKQRRLAGMCVCHCTHFWYQT
jgi:hypothetical protein